jgi:hypothetical protein
MRDIYVCLKWSLVFASYYVLQVEILIMTINAAIVVFSLFHVIQNTFRPCYWIILIVTVLNILWRAAWKREYWSRNVRLKLDNDFSKRVPQKPTFVDVSAVTARYRLFPRQQWTVLAVTDGRGLERYGESPRGRCSLSGPPTAYIRSTSGSRAIKMVESQLAERQEPAWIPKVLSEQSASEVSS